MTETPKERAGRAAREAQRAARTDQVLQVDLRHVERLRAAQDGQDQEGLLVRESLGHDRGRDGRAPTP